MEMKIGVIKGDGIGPEIVDEAMKVLDKTAEVYGHSINYTQLLMGGASIDVNGVPLTDETLKAAKESDAAERQRTTHAAPAARHRCASFIFIKT